MRKQFFQVSKVLVPSSIREIVSDIWFSKRQMGAAAAITQAWSVDALHVTDDRGSKHYGIGFAKAMFIPKEWKALKTFCNTYDIYQTDLNRLFNKYLSNDAAMVRQMRISTDDVKMQFGNQSLLTREIADIFIPLIFSLKRSDLSEPYSNKEVSFTRFVILGYRFCTQPMQDLVYDFFALTKGNFDLKLVSSIFSYNLQQILYVFSEAMQKSASQKYLLSRCNIKDNLELGIETIMRMSVKYPLMFYELQRFRSKFKRVFFGDKFWSRMGRMPSRFFEFPDDSQFASESSAVTYTARSIIQDFAKSDPQSICMDMEHYQVSLEANVEITSHTCVLMKNALGYRLARQIVEESRYVSLPSDQMYLLVPPECDVEERATDEKVKREFIFNVGTGLRAWIDVMKDTKGNVLKETHYYTDRSHLNQDSLVAAPSISENESIKSDR